MVFTWGDGRRGQLGHGELETWRSTPHCVEALKVSFFSRITIKQSYKVSQNQLYRSKLSLYIQAKSISRIAAGEGFSVFASDNGILMTCGDGTFGKHFLTILWF